MGNSRNKWWAINNLSEEVGEIKVFGDISSYDWWGEDVTFKDFNDQLLRLKNVKKIELRINSYGGVVSEAIAMYNSLKRFSLENNIETVTYIEGIAASAATIVALASDKVYMGTGTRFMIHNPSTGVRGASNNLRKVADYLDSVKNDIINIYQTKTKLSKEELENFMDEETFFDVEQAINHGFVDKSIELDENMLKNNIYNFGNPEIINKYFPQFKNKEELQIVEGGKVSIKNLSEFKNQYGVIAQEYKNEIRAELENEIRNKMEQEKTEAISAAVKLERERIKALSSIKVINKKHAEIVDRAKYDEPKNSNDIIVELYNTGAFEANALIEAGKIENKETGIDEITDEATEVKDVFEKAIDKVFGKGGEK